MNFMDIASIRKEYLQGGLRRCQMPDDPLVVFEEWLGEAVEARLVEPTAMVVATVSQECRPSTRTVLLKGLEGGPVCLFYQLRKPERAADRNQSLRLALVFVVRPRTPGAYRRPCCRAVRSGVRCLFRFPAVGQPHRRDSFAAKPGDRKPDRTDAGIRAHA